ncbi:bestrophin-like domain [Spirosoma rhododendri]|uniref:DUF4239 domain-containing protein n=1 Tax=Spirosoma rhododendri TaxID=2728024 RepID=A0A7L5DYS4_9BACT|nr:DUF4239 domain-containing protein [Spirosoma rhododendri]QJD80660.1 DUF4239 domain-containing protein [Spirosoma rhododendri]
MQQSADTGSMHLVHDDLLFMRWVYDLPTWLFGLLTVGVFVGAAVLGLRLTHSRLNRSSMATLIDNGTVGWFFSGVSLLYGLLLGLLTVATWSSFTQASSLASQEASIIAVLYRDLSGYPHPIRDTLQGDVKEYTHFVIEKAWPAQRKGYIYETGLLTQFQNHLLPFEPRTKAQEVLHGETLVTFNRLVETRRLRIESVKGSVPSVLWSVVMLGAIATIVFSYLFVVSSYRLHALLTGIMAGMVGLLVFLIAALDHPYWGEVSVSADAYQLVLDRVINQKIGLQPID